MTESKSNTETESKYVTRKLADLVVRIADTEPDEERPVKREIKIETKKEKEGDK